MPANLNKKSQYTLKSKYSCPSGTIKSYYMPTEPATVGLRSAMALSHLAPICKGQIVHYPKYVYHFKVNMHRTFLALSTTLLHLQYLHSLEQIYTESKLTLLWQNCERISGCMSKWYFRAKRWIASFYFRSPDVVLLKGGLACSYKRKCVTWGILACGCTPWHCLKLWFL